ncbi:hypothetical protein IU427_23435 [Nocardia beijingensis]|uniref:hypothetical protein n=1 Tax=Nocardia beijingensis TaxID=95162 RepID=UPI00189525F8|nr:hypothetical protein [Nocardia beijingensis]MBF6468122.1 hypothetical protein [Nocardia beijingensis]
MDAEFDDPRPAIVYSDNQLRVCEDRCTTCILRPGNLMMLQPGRRSQMVRDALRNEGHIPCHSISTRSDPQSAGVSPTCLPPISAASPYAWVPRSES